MTVNRVITTRFIDAAKNYELLRLLLGLIFFAVLTFAFTTALQAVFPQTDIVSIIEEEPVIEDKIESVQIKPADFQKTAIEKSKEIDKGLAYYRDENTKDSVIWFYTYITGSEKTANAILTNAEKNNIPVSLAFSLAYVESRYKTRAVNKNKNKTIDRGLFQLNSKSFSDISEEDFFDPEINAKIGLSHLKFCLDTAGNTISALAMYNAGTTKVKKGETPQMTLDYVSQIMTYRSGLDALFETEIIEKNCSQIPVQETPAQTVPASSKAVKVAFLK